MLLHWLWDASRGVAVWLTLVLTGTPVQWLLVEAGRAPAATLAQVHLFTTLSWVLLAADGLVGGLLLMRARRRDAAVTF